MYVREIKKNREMNEWILNFQLGKLIDTLEKQLTEKGQEINAYIEKHNIQVQGKKDRTEQKAIEEPTKPSSGVLVSPSEG